jgi:DNA recombination protein RmuC
MPGARFAGADFVLMFVPIEGAIEALSRPGTSRLALERKVALLSPQPAGDSSHRGAVCPSTSDTNAVEIASRAGLLYDKFAGFVDNLRTAGDRLRQAQQSYDEAIGQLSTGAGNLLRQAEMLRDLGARHTRQLDPRLVEQSAEPGEPERLA